MQSQLFKVYQSNGLKICVKHCVKMSAHDSFSHTDNNPFLLTQVWTEFKFLVFKLINKQ